MLKDLLNAPAPLARDLIARREQIRDDQRTGAKRDEQALRTERRWFEKNRPGEPLPEYLRGA
jgi:hypothetical protein